MSDLVGNPEDRFSRVAAHIVHVLISVGVQYTNITVLKQPHTFYAEISQEVLIYNQINYVQFSSTGILRSNFISITR